ncbi:unnamed protein product [Brachionus calyciflorus]|uniref:UV radiation resistance associated protein n=1 Tax=Brachionus calyciflorus TaxID=104777 RepID=A0A813TIE0_9BILA|nr:unnamed protein product [Brachionus calyciflorus]
MNQNLTNSAIHKQKRLRHITSLKAKNLQINSNRFNVWFTLHLNSHSPAFYISEKKENDRNPNWLTKNLNKFCFKQFILRIWYSNLETSLTNSLKASPSLSLLLEFEVDLDSLEWLGDVNLNFKHKIFNNLVLFEIFDTYFCEALSTEDKKSTKLTKKLENFDIKSENNGSKKSYDLNLMQRLFNYTRVLRENQKNTLNFKNNTLAKLQSMSQFKNLQIARDEKLRKIEIYKLNLENLNESISNLNEQNNKLNQLISIYKKNLETIKNKSIEEEDKMKIIRKKLDANLKIQYQIEQRLRLRQRELVTDLKDIFCISKVMDTQKNFIKTRILHAYIEVSSAVNEKIDKETSIGLGYVVQAIEMLSFILGIPLRYPCIFKCSKSFIIEFFDDSSNARKYALFKQYNNFDENFPLAIRLLERNVLQLRLLFDNGKSFVNEDMLTNLRWIFDHLKIL